MPSKVPISYYASECSTPVDVAEEQANGNRTEMDTNPLYLHW